MSRHTPTPSGPFIIDTHELGRRPGSERRLERVVPAPADLGIDVLGVTEGTDIALDLRLEAVLEGVLATGTATARLTGECVRCLDPIDKDLTVPFQELYLYHDVEAELSEDDLKLDDDYLDAEPLVRDAIVLSLPVNPVCRPDCMGLCPTCGFRLLDDPSHAHEEPIDARWAALTGLDVTDSDSDDIVSEDGRG
ncbi:DUF177 domain-containing protein [soil metagenome]